EAYDIDASGKNVIFNSIDAYTQFSDKVSPGDSIALIFDYKSNYDTVQDIVSSGKINALKLHSRIQEIADPDYPELIDKLEGVNPTLPIIIDSFYYGYEMEFQPSLKAAVTIAKQFSHIPVIIAHAGGYNALQYF